METQQIEPIEINVTDEDIANGKRMQVGCCMVSLAAQRAFGINQLVNGYVVVSQFDITVVRCDFDKSKARTSEEKRSEWLLPTEVTTIIKAWDDGGPAAPFSFKPSDPVTGLKYGVFTEKDV